jgi:hypothetical protein
MTEGANMVGSTPLRCQRCGKPIGYVTVTVKSSLQTKPDLDNVKVVGTCMDCTGGSGFYPRNF